MTATMNANALRRREEGCAARSAEAQDLVGKTIAAAVVEPHDPGCDGQNVLRLAMTDGSVFLVTGGYGGYTGNSCDDYFEQIDVARSET